MSKSIFAKYIVTFTLIILVIFGMMMTVIMALISSHSVSLQTEIAKSAAKSAESYIELKYEYSNTDKFDEYIKQNKDDILNIITSIAQNCDGISLILTDADGRLILYASGHVHGFFESEEYLPQDTLKKLQNREDAQTTDKIGKKFTASHIAYAIPVVDENAMQGSVVAISSGDSLAVLINATTRAILVSSLWILLAALIAVYFITEMITGPLRQMSRAAKKMAVGKFDVRIPVRGKDEVAELAASFNHMAESLQNLETMRNNFMANVSHDLRTPMTTISGFIDNILVGAIPKEEHPYYLGIIKEEVRRLSRLVSSLLDISRLQAGDRKFSMSTFDICEMARLILISFEQKIDEKRLDVDFDCTEDRVFVYADRDAIYQVLYNICDNAVKFSSECGKYSIKIEKFEENKERKVLISVYNQGQGIDENDIPYVFERFYKADKSRGIDRKGVGLGMFISKTIIDAHGEKIFVESKKNEYCKFSFTLAADEQSKETI